MNTRFSAKLEKALKSAGWFVGRETDTELNKLCFQIHVPGAQFLKEFGGLAIGRTLFCDAEDANAEFIYRTRIEAAQLPNCLPVGSSWYWCEGSLWIEEFGRVYQADDYNLALAGETVDEALELLILRKKLPANYPRWEITPRPISDTSKSK